MKTLISILLLSLLSIQASAEVLATLQTEDGTPAYVVGEYAAKTSFSTVSFGLLTIEINGETYRIASDSEGTLLAILCAPFKKDFPYVYSTVVTRDTGFIFGGEKVARISSDNIVTPSDDEVIIDYGYCQKEMY